MRHAVCAAMLLVSLGCASVPRLRIAQEEHSLPRCGGDSPDRMTCSSLSLAPFALFSARF